MLAAERDLLRLAGRCQQSLQALQPEIGPGRAQQNLLAGFVGPEGGRLRVGVRDARQEQALRGQEGLADLDGGVPAVCRGQSDSAAARQRDHGRRAGMIERPGRRKVRLPGRPRALHARAHHRGLRARRGHVGPLRRGQLQRLAERRPPPLPPCFHPRRRRDPGGLLLRRRRERRTLNARCEKQRHPHSVHFPTRSPRAPRPVLRDACAGTALLATVSPRRRRSPARPGVSTRST